MAAGQRRVLPFVLLYTKCISCTSSQMESILASKYSHAPSQEVSCQKERAYRRRQASAGEALESVFGVLICQFFRFIPSFQALFVGRNGGRHEGLLHST